MLKKVSFPAIIISTFIAASFGIISIGHVLSNKPLLFLNYKESYGLDYADFFKASENIINGQSPYDVSTNRYVTTPIPAIANTVFVPLGFDNARILFYFLIPLSLAFGYQLITSMFGFSKIDKDLILTAGLAALLFGYPFYFLLQRENIDGWVFLFLCLGLYWLQNPKKEWASGLFFSLAIVFKVYPMLIVLPILLSKKWRLVFWIGLWLVLWGSITLFWFSDFQTALSSRSQSLFRFDENGSLVATISLILILINSLGISSVVSLVNLSPIITVLIYGILLSLVIFADYKLGRVNKLETSSFIMYFPFMLALPLLVYHYSFIICLILIPTMCHLWGASEDRLQRMIIFAISIGIAMTQWQAIATYSLTENMLSHAIPGLGLLLIMAGIAFLKIYTLRLTQRVMNS